MLEEIIRRIVREELAKIEQRNAENEGFADDEVFAEAAAKVFQRHKKVLDALA